MKRIDVPQKYIDEYQQGKTLRELERQYHIGRGVLKRAITEKGINIRHNPYRKDITLDMDIFENIDSFEKAYWLGFIAADGYSGYNKKKTNGTVIIRLQQKDRNHLEKFKIFTNTSNSIVDILVKDGFSNPEKGTAESEITIYSKKMVDDLADKGVLSPKSLTLKAPNISEEFYGAYIAGYFDGDGTIHKTKSNNGYISYCCGFIGTKELLTWIANYVGYPDTTFSKRYNDNKNNYYIRWGGNNKPLEVLNTFYPLSPVHLDRKYKLYQELLNVVQSRKSIE